MRRASVIGALLSAFLMVVVGTGCKGDQGLTIKRVEPKVGTEHGGDRVTIHGTGFSSDGATGVTIYFGDREVRPDQIVGDREMIVKSPPGPKGQSVDIQIVFDDARQFLYKDAFTYHDRSQGFGVDEMVTGDSEDEDE